MEYHKIIATVAFIAFLCVMLYLIQSYMFQKTILAEQYAPLIGAGQECIKQMNEIPYGPLPLCKITLDEILNKNPKNDSNIVPENLRWLNVSNG